MAKINDGGPAFPSDELDQDGVPNGWQYKGLSIRDWFAGQALGSVVMATAQGFNRPEPKFDGEKVSSVLAREAYSLADAMLAEREKTNAEP